MNYKVLNIKGINLEEKQLEKYLIQEAEEHIIGKKSDKRTYPIKILRKNYLNILRTYELLNKHIKLGITVHAAGEWLLDNFYVIEETVKRIKKSITRKQYMKFPGIMNGKYKGFARIYVLASEIVAFNEEVISEEKILNAIRSYQMRKILSMEEIWNIGLFIQLAIIQKISDMCNRIYDSQIEKYKVENIYERLVEKKINSERKFNEKIRNKKKITDMNYPFIEYMVYKLRRTGKKGSPYIEILEKQLNKFGETIDDIIQKEHLYIATIKIQIGVNITSIKSVNRINFEKIFEKTNKIEEILNKDPSGYFQIQTDDTKELYRNRIKEISKKIGVSEIYITEEILKLCYKYKNTSDIEDKRKIHVGYYIIDDGIIELKEKKKKKKIKQKKKNSFSKIYISLALVIPFLTDFILTSKTSIEMGWKTFLFIVQYIIIYKINIKIINYILSKIRKTQKIPKVDFSNGIPEDAKTVVAIPTILDEEEKVEKMIRKMETYYLANKDKNIYFSLLGDCTTSEKEVENLDRNIIEIGIKKTEELNKKYNEKNRFSFLYRKRRWNPKEEKFLGWERKRGLLLQFNNLLISKKNEDFIANTLINFEEKIRYVITLDSDTNLVLDSAQKMIGAMYHILNRPIIKNNIVVDGYGIMQPRIGITLEDSQKTLFTKIFSGNPGIDLYTNNIFDIYQDCFKEGIFTGKGIYDLNVFQVVLEKKLPENRILSHDLIEGNYLRCALLSDVVLLDSFPTHYLAYIERENRWIRGDWQIANWIEKKVGKKENNICSINKFKIFDNLIRSIFPIVELFLLFFSIAKGIIQLLMICVISLFITTILEIINKIIYKKSITEEKVYADKQFYKNFSGIMGNLLRNGIEVSILPEIAFNSLSAIAKTLYRLKKKKKLLEWKTSDQADKNMINNLEYYYKKMIINVVLGILMFGVLNPLGMVLGTLWLFGPYIGWKISQKIYYNQNASDSSKKYLNDLAVETWKYFSETINEENNYLVPDNYQEGRKNEYVNRTSSTNIGLEILSIISANDLGFIKKKEAIDLLTKVIEVVVNLPKWNGHLYNWYNIKNLHPLKPEYVSTVDSGNFIRVFICIKNIFRGE